jgi:hypothetical protein
MSGKTSIATVLIVMSLVTSLSYAQDRRVVVIPLPMSEDAGNYNGTYVNVTGDAMVGSSSGPILSVTNSGSGVGFDATTKGNISVRGLATTTGTGVSYGGYFEAYKDAGMGVAGAANGVTARGVYGYAGHSTGANFGVRGKTNSPNGYGGYFEGRGYFSGNVGIGTTAPKEKLHVEGNIRIPSDSGIINAEGRKVFQTGSSSWFGDYTGINSGKDWNGGAEPVSVVAGSNGVYFTKGDGSGAPHKVLLAHINTSGQLGVKSLSITGGSDIAEPFEVKNTDAVKAGMVMAIDPDHPGCLKIADRAYDTRVAGVVSGAGGISPGVILTQENSTLNGSTHIALSGRVYCLAEAAQDPIEPGDMLTTSDKPGHAMKATDRERFFGAVIGKAMTPLEKGTGLVLVLVSLQ